MSFTMPPILKRQSTPFLNHSSPHDDHEPTTFLMHQSSLSLFQHLSDLEESTDEEYDDEEDLVRTQQAGSRTPSPIATNDTSDQESTPSPHASPILSFASSSYEFPATSFDPSQQHSNKRRRLVNGGKKKVQFDLAANTEHQAGSTLHLISRRNPSALLRSSFQPTSILIRRPGDIPSTASSQFSQTTNCSSQASGSILSQPFMFFLGNQYQRPSPSTTPSPSPEFQLSPMIPHSASPEHEPSSTVACAASAMAQSLGSLFAPSSATSSSTSSIFLQPTAFTRTVELNGERYSLPTESLSQPLPSHSTLFDELGSSESDHEQELPVVAAQKRSLDSSRSSSPPKRFRTDPSARRRGGGASPGASDSPSPSSSLSSPRRMPAMLRREASYGSCLQRQNANSSSLDLTNFFEGIQQQRQSSPLRNEITQNATSAANDSQDDQNMVL